MSKKVPSASEQAVDQLIVCNYNVNFVFTRDGLGDDNSKQVFNALMESDADVICLQETHGGFEQFLLTYSQGQLTKSYPHYVFYHHGGAGGQAFFSKFPFVPGSEQIIELKQNGVEGSWFPMHLISVNVTKNGKSSVVQFVNVHLRPPLNDDGSAHLWTAYITNRFRLGEVRYLMEKLEEQGVVTLSENKEQIEGVKNAMIILGDYNEHDNDPALSWLTNKNQSNKQVFRDALKDYVPSSRETHRWPIKLMWGYVTYWSHKRLDHCVYSVDSLQCTNCKVLDGYEDNASDHQPIVSTFKLL